MAKYVRSEPYTVRTWVVQYGVPALAVAVGAAMTGFTNFWLGIAIMGAAICWSAFDFWRIHREAKYSKKLGFPTVILTSYLIVLWFMFVGAPLDVLVASPKGSYPAGSDVKGIKWDASFSPLEIMIKNDTDVDYSNFDVFGAVAICVGIEFGAISSMTRLSDYAARSMI